MAQDLEPVPGAEEMCAHCGHPWNPHQVFGYGDPPTEGWIECPVEGCTCRMTWSEDPHPADAESRPGDDG